MNNSKFTNIYKKLRLQNQQNYLTVDTNTLLDDIAKSLKNGTDVIEFNPLGATVQKAIEQAKKIQLLCNEFEALFIVNERADLAFVLEADGIILNEFSLTPHQAREILGENALIGIVCANQAQLNTALKSSADFIKTLNFVNNIPATDKKIFDQH